MDWQVETVDVLLTVKRDTKPALRCLRKAIRSNGKPRLINIDLSGANNAAIRQFNFEEYIRIKIRQTLAGIELIRMIRKGQMRNQARMPKTVAELCYGLAGQGNK